MKESYIKLPNITTSKLQDVVDYLDENNIEYIEEYKRDEEIERLKKQLNDEIDDELKQSEIMVKQHNEIERLNSIIKEVREYIEDNKAKLPLGINDFTCEMVYSDEVVLANELLEILDKVGEE